MCPAISRTLPEVPRFRKDFIWNTTLWLHLEMDSRCGTTFTVAQVFPSNVY